jgi:hypothetical protein
MARCDAGLLGSAGRWEERCGQKTQRLDLRLDEILGWLADL